MFSLKSIFVLLIAVLSIHALATVNYWYWKYPWLDMPMHFLGGFWTAMVYLWLNPKFEIQNQKIVSKFPDYLIAVLSVSSFVALIGVSWEFFEFFYDIFISSKGYGGFLQLGAADTLSDLFFDIFGGAVFVFIFKLLNKNK